MDRIDVYLSAELRYGPRWPVSAHLRPTMPVHWPADFHPLFERLAQPADRATWRRYDYVTSLSMADAEAWPIIGEA